MANTMMSEGKENSRSKEKFVLQEKERKGEINSVMSKFLLLHVQARMYCHWETSCTTIPQFNLSILFSHVIHLGIVVRTMIFNIFLDDQWICTPTAFTYSISLQEESNGLKLIRYLR